MPDLLFEQSTLSRQQIVQSRLTSFVGMRFGDFMSAFGDLLVEVPAQNKMRFLELQNNREPLDAGLAKVAAKVRERPAPT